MNIIHFIFLLALKLLCKQHILNIILVNIKIQKTFIRSNEKRNLKVQKNFIKQYTRVTLLLSPLIYYQYLVTLKTNFQQYSNLLKYIKTVCFDLQFKKCVQAQRDYQLYFDNYIIFHIKSSYSILKYYFKILTKNLKFVQEKINSFLTNQYSEYIAAIVIAKNKST